MFDDTAALFVLGPVTLIATAFVVALFWPDVRKIFEGRGKARQHPRRTRKDDMP